MKSSVVISTYNGSKYIIEQLESIRKQERVPDEVIIIDDCSKDNTARIVKQYIENNNLKNWQLHINATNKGWKKNFFDGINMSSGDVVFPCDQDDVWHLDKISKMMSIMEKNDNISVLEGKPHRFFDEDNVKTNKRSVRTIIGIILDKRDAKANQSKNSEKVSIKQFDSSFMKRAPGCALAIRCDCFHELKRYWFDEMPHDALLTYFPLVSAQYYIFDYEVIEWRQHVGSASRPKERNKKRRIEELMLDKKMLDVLSRYASVNNISNSVANSINCAKRWNTARIDVVKNKRFSAIPLLFKYQNYYIQKRRIITDIKYSLER